MSNISVDSSFRSQAGSGIQAPRSENVRDSGAFTRKVADGVGRPFRGPMPTTGLTAEQQIDPAVLAEVNSHLHLRFMLSAGFSGPRRAEFSFALPNGDKATITGDEKTQNVRIQTRSGAVMEANIGVNGAQAVRGFSSPRELHDQLMRLATIQEWPSKHLLEPR